jgi:hypothetical protein
MVRVGLEPTDQLRQVGNGQFFSDRDDLRIGRDQRDRLEILYDIIFEWIGRTIEHMRRYRAENQHVPVGFGACDLAGSNTAGRARRVLHDHGLSELRLQSLRHDTTDRVGRSARWKRHDQRNCPLG